MHSANRKEKPQRYVGQSQQQKTLQGLMLFFLPAALIPASIIALGRGHFIAIIVNAGALAIYLLAAVLLRKGIIAEKIYQENEINPPPKWPYKTFAAILVATTTGLIAWLGIGETLAVAMVYALCAFLGMYLSYGLDPRTRAKIQDSGGYTGAEITQMLEEARQKIVHIEQANAEITNAEMNRRISTICGTANNILTEIKSDPKDLRRTRKFLNVYLEGASQVTSGYAKTHQQTQNEALEQNFRNVLQTIEEVFAEQHRKLLEEEVFDLDVQIEVLNTQLKHEGIR